MPTTVTKTIKSAGGDYGSLSSAEAGEQGVHSNLVSRDEIMAFECYAISGGDTSKLTISGWTTDATRYIRIYTPAAERRAAATALRLDTTKYYMNVNDDDCVENEEDFVRFEGIQFTNNSPGGDSRHLLKCNLALSASNEIRISYCNFKGHGHATFKSVGINVDAANAVVKVWNCLFYNFGSGSGNSRAALGVTGTSLTLYSCTGICAGDNVFERDSITTMVAKNCYAGGSITSDWQGTITKTTCASEDTSADGTSPKTNIALSTATFVNVTATTEDYHLVTGAGIKDFGTDTSGDAAPFNFTDDIDEVARTGTWDIGADEFAGAAGLTAAQMAGIFSAELSGCVIGRVDA